MNIFLGPPHPEVVCMQGSLRSSSTVTIECAVKVCHVLLA